MIQKIFENGGFPINKRNPVLLFTTEGELFVAYDRFSLKAVIDSKKITKCVGIWPGKLNTDCFPLNPDKYKLHAPPEEHRMIDNATDIKAYYFDLTNFKQILYTIENPSGSQNTVISKDKSLLDYITAVGLKHSTIYGQQPNS